MRPPEQEWTMLPRHEHLLREIVYSARLIQSRGDIHNAQDFTSDAGLRAIVERKVEISGDDLIRLRDEDRALFLRIAGGDDLIGFRNVVAYRDADADDGDGDYPPDRFWHEIQRAIPDLLLTIERFLPHSSGP